MDKRKSDTGKIETEKINIDPGLIMIDRPLFD